MHSRTPPPATLGGMSAILDPAAFFRDQWSAVTSSNVAAAKYDFDNSNLYVRFKDGKTYQYLGISLDQAQDFASAPSAGKWIWTHLRIRGTKDGSQVTFIEM